MDDTRDLVHGANNTTGMLEIELLVEKARHAPTGRLIDLVG